MQWVAEKRDEFNLIGPKILEVGSYDVNGSVRPLFSRAGSYVGVDFRPGPGVDLTMNAHCLKFPDRSFDLVISTEMLEHDDQFWVSLQEMGRVLKGRDSC